MGAVQTYKYFQPDTFLRPEYGGAAIQNGGDSAEVLPIDLTMRYICNQLNIPTNATSYLCVTGQDGSSNWWFRVTDDVYTAISSYLSAAELATVQSSAPAGFVLRSNLIKFQPNANKINLFLRGDSISAGLGTTTGDTRDVFIAQAVNSLAGQTLSYYDTTYREGESLNYKIANMSLGGSSWANTAGGGAPGSDAYPLREDLAYPQRTQTLCFDNDSQNIFTYWLGTNDLAYDGTLTGADAWTRAATRIAALRAQYPDLKIIVCTTVKREMLAPLNNRINDYNVLMRANFLTAGADALADFEADISQLNITTGVTTDTLYYTDEIHLTNLSHSLLKNVWLDAVNSLLA